MDKTFKGAVAAGGAAVLLLGGLGTLAFWTDDETVTGGSISSGQLSLGEPDCGTGWSLDGGAVWTTQLLVPGDTLTKTCTIDLVADGEHLGADLELETTSFTTSNGLTDDLAASAVFTVGGATTTQVTSADDNKTTPEISVVVSVVFDGPTAVNASQNLTAVLNDLTFTATQTHDAA